MVTVSSKILSDLNSNLGRDYFIGDGMFHSSREYTADLSLAVMLAAVDAQCLDMY